MKLGKLKSLTVITAGEVSINGMRQVLLSGSHRRKCTGVNINMINGYTLFCGFMLTHSDNGAVVNIFSFTCALPAVTSQNICCEKNEQN